MEQNLLNSDLSVGNNLDGEYEFLKALGLIEDDTEVKIGDDDGNNEFGTGYDTDDEDDNEFWTVNDDIEEEDDWWDPSKQYTGHDYIAHFGREAWDELLQARFARHRNIVLREFTRRPPNISEQVKNKQFDIFSESTEFGPIEHNALLDALAHPVKRFKSFRIR
jgi:hypothetical protein